MVRPSPRVKDFLSRCEVAALFCVSPNTVTRWADAGKLPYIRTLGGHRRYVRTDIEDLAKLNAKEDNLQSVTYQVPSMYGDHHVTAVQRLLSALSGVDQVWASAAFRKVIVRFDPELINADAIAASLEGAGYATDGEYLQQGGATRNGDRVWDNIDIRMTQTHPADG